MKWAEVEPRGEGDDGRGTVRNLDLCAYAINRNNNNNLATWGRQVADNAAAATPAAAAVAVAVGHVHAISLDRDMAKRQGISKV